VPFVHSCETQAVCLGCSRIFNLAQGDNLALARTVLGRMLAPGLWKPCTACSRTETCPILLNKQILSNPAIPAQKRLFLAYRRLYASEPEYIDWGLQIGDCGFKDMTASRSSQSKIADSQNPHSEIQNPNSAGWRELEIPSLTMLTFRHEAHKEWQSHPFRFVCQEQRKADL